MFVERHYNAVQIRLMAVIVELLYYHNPYGFSAFSLNFCNKRQEIEAGTWVAGIACFRYAAIIFYAVTY